MASGFNRRNINQHQTSSIVSRLSGCSSRLHGGGIQPENQPTAVKYYSNNSQGDEMSPHWFNMVHVFMSGNSAARATAYVCQGSTWFTLLKLICSSSNLDQGSLTSLLGLPEILASPRCQIRNECSASPSWWLRIRS